MNKRIIKIVAAALAASGLSATALPQQQASGLAFTYTAGIQVQNLSNAQATIVITFYNPDGTQAGTTNDTIPANGSKTYFPLSAVSAGFDGSAIISADQQVAAIVNVLGNNGVAGAAYSGSPVGSPTVDLPLLMKNNFGFNTWFKVQNAGNTATNITVNYSDGTSASATNVQPGASAIFDQSLEAHNAAVFAATVTSNNNQPLVAAVIEESSSVMFAYSGFASGSTNPVMPLVNANNFGYITGIQIKNGGSSASSVTVTYTRSSAPFDSCTETRTIQAGQSETFALYAFSVAGTTSSNCPFGQTFVGSARVTANSANVPLTVIVNQLNNSQGTGEAYGGFDPAQATSKVVMPLIMDRNFGYFTGFNVMNIGTAATNVTCTFTNSSRTVTASLNPGQALTDVQLNQLGNGYVGSATCTGGAGSKLAGVVNELNNDPPPSDKFLVYEAISTN